jgi:hypothetical protein
MADEGMNILFVPFLTDTQMVTLSKTLCSSQSYRKQMLRCYRWLCWKLTESKQYGYQYAHMFSHHLILLSPSNGIKAEATPNMK